MLIPASLLVLACAEVRSHEPVYLPYADAQPVLEALAEIQPEELKSQPAENRPAMWPAWVASRDAEIRRRLEGGEEDSLVNLLLFGTSYTRQPRLTAEFFAGVKPQEGRAGGGTSSTQPSLVERTLATRSEDLIRALMTPGSNERLQFMRRLLERKGYRLNTPAGRQEVHQYLYANLVRVQGEMERYSEALKAARRQGDASEEFARRSQLFQDRGISLDASLLPNFALEESLRAMSARGLLAPGSVRRVAIIGPGLDFVDKSEGHDFYPPQTIQPFAVVDSLLRLGLSTPGSVEVSTFDISARVNAHMAHARLAAGRGRGYVVHLPLDSRVAWTPAAVQYWKRFGDQIGRPATPLAAPRAADSPKVRAVRIRPAIVARVTPFDLNIVYQRLDLSPEEGFDLIVATNIFVYYGVFEQSLALVNVEHMLKPGGILLSNNALLELPVSRLRSVDYQASAFSDRPDDGEQIVWYRLSPP